ncbi:MAG TPA: sulfatase [Chryseosolibacter sp.]
MKTDHPPYVKHRLWPYRVYLLSVALLLLAAFQGAAQKNKSIENFVILFADDQGYGDLGCYGHPTIRTPNIDRMAAEGQRWTTFYTAENVCTPSRAGLLTGRLPIRNGMYSDHRRVLFPDSDGGLPASEITLAELLKSAGYRTAAIGKWHLGHLPPYLPTSNGFDSYFGIPYSNDMDRIPSVTAREAIMNPRIEYFQVPLMRDEAIVERPADQTTITKRYTADAVRIISENKRKPFFLYLAYSLPHVPLFASQDFRGKSKRGLYGDVVEEIDWSVGEILKTLKKQKLDKKTLVVFTSDNGPWVIWDEHGGSAGPLHGAKATGYEGGQRVPAIFWAPGNIKPAVITDMGSTLDLFPTIAKLAGVAMPTDRIYDGYDLTGVLLGGGESPRKEMFYYHGTRIFAARKGDFKLYFYENNPDGYPERMRKLDTLRMYNLQHDPSEKFDIAPGNAGVADEIKALVRQHEAGVVHVDTQIEKRIVNK